LEWEFPELDKQQDPQPHENGAWWTYLVMVIIVIGVLAVFQFIIGGEQAKAPKTMGSNPVQSLKVGDSYAKYALAGISKGSAQKAIDSYKQALPWPSAYRRIGVAKQVLLNKSGLHDLEQINSRAATAGMSKREIRKLNNEAGMWRAIYSSRKLTPAQVRDYTVRIRKLNLGTLKTAAVSIVYRRAGETARADAVMRNARGSARSSAYAAGAFMAFLGMCGLAGLVLAILFLVNAEPYLSSLPRIEISPTILLRAFLSYFVSFIILSVVIGTAGSIGQLFHARLPNGVQDLIIELAVMVLSAAIGLSTLWSMAGSNGQDPKAIGYKFKPAGENVLWGLGGFIASLPLVAAMSLLSNWAFRRIHTPEQPIIPMVSSGNAAVVALAFIVACVAAPIIEETFFRGTLYNAFRGKTGTWPSVLATSALFAAVHPLPGNFLPIFTLACILAILRERTGSLLPGMVCHSVFNTSSLIIALLGFG